MSYLEYIENPFKACSDEWADRSLINSLIWTTSLEIESKNETIKLHERQIQSDKDKGFYPNPMYTDIEEWIKEYKREVRIMIHQLKVLKADGRTDKDKLELYWTLNHENVQHA